LIGLWLLGQLARVELVAHLEEVFYYLYRRHYITSLSGFGNELPGGVRGLLRAKAIGVPT
jgi:hypothetical protein